jgi:hypothetical protein
MSGDAFERATPGKALAIPAAAWNACLDAADAHKRGEMPPFASTPKQFRQADIVLVKNASGSNVSRFHVLGISGVIFTPTASLRAFQDQVTFTGVTPTDADHKGKFVICLDAIKSGQVGRAWIAGVAQVQVNVTDTAHGFCDVKNTDRTQLQSASSGNTRILWKESGTGTKWAVVRLNDPSGGDAVRLGKPAGGNWVKGTTATINIWESGTPPSETQTTGVSISGCVNKFATVASGKWVMIARAGNGSWYLIAAEC